MPDGADSDKSSWNTLEQIMRMRERLARLETKMNMLGAIGTASLVMLATLIAGILLHWI